MAPLTEMEAMPRNCKGYSHALATALWADPRAESGGESIARGRMLLLGYELPDLQVAVPNKIEGGFYYGDFGWKRPNGELLGELDGRDKYTDPEMTDGKSAAEVMADEGLHFQLKKFFIDGTPLFMSLVALALVLGLAFCIIRAEVRSLQRFCCASGPKTPQIAGADAQKGGLLAENDGKKALRAR